MSPDSSLTKLLTCSWAELDLRVLAGGRPIYQSGSARGLLLLDSLDDRAFSKWHKPL